MTQLNDCRYDALIAQGFTGHTNDMLLAWAQSNGATSNQLNDALLEVLLLNGATSNTLNDAWFESLGSLGITGARNDRELTFWCDFAGAFAIKALTGWTGTENCAAITIGTHTVKFNKPVSFISHEGVSFVNTTTAETATGATVINETSPTDTMTYTNVTWVTEPVALDAVEYRLDGFGSYSDMSTPSIATEYFNVADRDLNGYIGLPFANTWATAGASTDLKISSGAVVNTGAGVRDARLLLSQGNGVCEFDVINPSTFQVGGMIIRNQSDADQVRCLTIQVNASTARLQIESRVNGVSQGAQNFDVSGINLNTNTTVVVTDTGTQISMHFADAPSFVHTYTNTLPEADDSVGVRIFNNPNIVIDNLKMQAEGTRLSAQILQMINCAT